MNAITTRGNTVCVTVELFGMARVHADARSFSIEVASPTSVTALLGEVAWECPALVGNALCVSDDGAIAVADGYALNRNGLVFLSPDTDEQLEWVAADSLLLLSNQAGG